MKIIDTLRIVELAWLIVITICVFEIVKSFVLNTHEKTYLYLVIGLGATAMYVLRRTQRKRYSKRQENNSRK